MKRGKKIKIIVLIVVVVLVAFRLALPFIVTRYVNKVLSELQGYRGSVEDVDIHLYRGAYQIHQLNIIKVEGNSEVPFINIATVDLSVEWNAIFHGSVVGEIVFVEPVINFIGGGSEDDQSGQDVDWTKTVKDLIPLRINRLEVDNGKITFKDFTAKPAVDLYLHEINGVAENLSNVVNEQDTLPSSLRMTANSIGGGHLSVDMRMNVLKTIPDLDMDLKFENVNLPALNKFFDAYAKIDVEKGDFDLYAEMVVLDGDINGYVKPIIEDLKVVNWKEDKKKPLKLIWEAIVGTVAEIFQNQPKDRFATKVPLSGSIKEVDASIFPTLWNIFRNAFIQAFEKNTDGTISIDNPDGDKKK